MTRAHALRSPRPAPRSRGLFKPDRPRAIDRYIDYFGGGAGHPDPCGEALLDCLGTEADTDAMNAARGLASNG